MKDLVSIIIPVFNVEKYLCKCINSVINQTYKNIEIILIDDSSTDKSGNICDYYSNIDNRIKVIHKENEGVSVARNTGLDLANGEYIAFVDSDDYIEKNMIEIMVKNIKKIDGDMSICGYDIFYENQKNNKKSDVNGKDICMNNDEVLEEIFLSNKINGFLWNKLFSKRIFNKIRLPKEMDICEDLYTVCKILTKDMKIYYTNKSLYNYRNTSSSLTKDINKIFLENGELKYTKAYEKIEILYANKIHILELIKLRKIKTIMESYYIVLKNKYNNKLINSYIRKSLKEHRRSYLLNKNVNLKLKFAFISFYSVLTLKAIRRNYE